MSYPVFMNGSEQRQDEVAKRLRKILDGAFAGPPTPLKDMPKRRRRAGARKASPRRKKTT